MLRDVAFVGELFEYLLCKYTDKLSLYFNYRKPLTFFPEKRHCVRIVVLGWYVYGFLVILSLQTYYSFHFLLAPLKGTPFVPLSQRYQRLKTLRRIIPFQVITPEQRINRLSWRPPARLRAGGLVLTAPSKPLSLSRAVLLPPVQPSIPVYRRSSLLGFDRVPEAVEHQPAPCTFWPAL